MAPTNTAADAGVTVTEATGTTLTVTLAVSLRPSLVAMIDAVPAATPRATPEASTVAIAVLLDCHVMTRPVRS